jgi:beta-lactamase superfamily II metal-dependent hydrolase
MEVRVYDVEHGDCIFLLSSQGEAVLVDCGYNSTTKWRPTQALIEQGFGTRRKLQHTILTHADQDHLADLPNVLDNFPGVHIWQHPQLRISKLSELKPTLSKAQAAYLSNRKTAAELQPIEASRRFRSMELRMFYLPLGAVRDVNDLSLVSFISEDGFTVCLPGDLTARGWRRHLQNTAFQFWLRETNLFLASHHGRPSGYYAPVFEYLFPKLICISDKEQAKGRALTTRAPYRDHARGVKLPDGSFRRVLTTSSDGRIRIQVTNGKWQVTTSRTKAPQASQSN